MQNADYKALAFGLSEQPMVELDKGVTLQEDTAWHFMALQKKACESGLALCAASGFRSYRAQLAIFDAKWAAQRPVLDDQDRPLRRSDYTDEEWLTRILRFSALPGTSRHHWGTDIDVYDSSLLPNGQALRLVPSEYGEEGCFAALTAWIDRQIETDSAEGFSRPYDHDRGGVAVEPWHLSYLPQASLLSKWVTPEALIELWMQAPDLRPQCYKLVADRLGAIFDQYVVS